jgi:hypothetical protein
MTSRPGASRVPKRRCQRSRAPSPGAARPDIKILAMYFPFKCLMYHFEWWNEHTSHVHRVCHMRIIKTQLISQYLPERVLLSSIELHFKLLQHSFLNIRRFLLTFYYLFGYLDVAFFSLNTTFNFKGYWGSILIQQSLQKSESWFFTTIAFVDYWLHKVHIRVFFSFI